MSLFPKNHLSHPSKIPVPTFDLDVDRTGCVERCTYGKSKVCYVVNNPNENYPSRKAILKRNWDLINSDQFVAVLTKQIRHERINDFRFFSSGDFFDLESIEKIIIGKLKNSVPMAELPTKIPQLKLIPSQS